MLYQDERHIMTCWSSALFDTAENLGEAGGIDAVGNEVTPAYIREVALTAKAEGTSTCVCHEDDEWYAMHVDHARPALVAIEVAARYYGFAEDLLALDDAAALEAEAVDA